MARRDIKGVVDFAYLEAFAAGDDGVIDEVLALFREQSDEFLSNDFFQLYHNFLNDVRRLRQCRQMPNSFHLFFGFLLKAF